MERTLTLTDASGAVVFHGKAAAIESDPPHPIEGERRLLGPETVEILISADGRSLWINGPLGSVLRASGVGSIVVRDMREPIR